MSCGITLRRACGLFSISRSSVAYETQSARDDKEISEAVRVLAAKHPRFGYRRIHDVPPLLWTVCLRQLRTAGGSHLIVDWTEIVKAGVTPDGIVKGPNVVLDFPHCVRLALPFVAVNELNF